MRYLIQLAHWGRDFRWVKEHSNFSTVCLFLLASILGRQRDFELRRNDRPLYVQSTTPDVAVARSCFSGEFQAARAVVPKNARGIIIDGGGYIGTEAMTLAELFPDQRVITIEPHADNYKILEKNVAKYPTIHPGWAALAPDSEPRKLLDRGTGPVGYTVSARPSDAPDAGEVGLVPAITIEELLAGQSHGRIVPLKLDIEGGEADLLCGPPEWMTQVQSIVAELHDRIDPRCSRRYYEATDGMVDHFMDGEKVWASRKRTPLDS